MAASAALSTPRALPVPVPGALPSKKWAVRRRLRRTDMRDASYCDRMRKIQYCVVPPSWIFRKLTFCR
jgi:hypothetical protein